jgi:hypothetical protein
MMSMLMKPFSKCPLARLNISEFDLIYIQIASKYANTVKFLLERKGIKAFKLRESL